MFLALPSEQWRRNQIAVILSAAIIFAGFTFVMPFLPFFVSSLGIKGRAVAVWSGILLSVSPLLAALLGPVWGRAAERYGMKLMLGRVVVAMMIHWFFMIFVWNIYSLLALRIFLGIFSGFNAMSVALITHGCPRERIGRSIGTLQSFQILAVGFGPFMGGLLYDSIGLRATCGITSMMCLGSFIIIALLYKDISAESMSDVVTRAGDENGRIQQLGFMEIIRLPGVVSLLILLFFANLVSRSFATITPLFVEMLSMTKENLGFSSGIIVSFSAFAEALSAFIFGHLASRIMPKKLVVLALTGGVLTILPMAFVQSELQFLLLRIVAGLLTGGTMTLAFTTGGGIFPEKSRATSYAILSSTAMLGGALGPFTSGLIAATNLRITFIVAAIIYFLLIMEAAAGIRKEAAVRAQAAARAAAGEKPAVPFPR